MAFLGGEAAIAPAARWSALARVWSLAAAPLSLVSVAHGLDPIHQGYYYTFAALLAAGVLVELGLGQVLLIIAAHYRVNVEGISRMGITGSGNALDRLGWLLRRGTGWISWSLPLQFLVIGGGGCWLLAGRATGQPVDWLGPWLAAVALAGLMQVGGPALAILEGCGLVVDLARLRFAQAVVPCLVLWMALWSGLGLWSPVASAVVLAAITGWFLLDFRPVFGALVARGSGPSFRWLDEVWPLQWRFALSWIGGYLLSQCLTPLVFRLDGPEAAGRMGMSQSLAWALIGVGSVWVNAATPELGRLAASREWDALDVLFSRVFRRGAVSVLVGAAAILLGVLILERYLPQLATRFLPLPQLAWVLGFAIVHTLMSSLAVFLRAHRCEPFMALSLFEAACIFTACWVAARHWGVGGVVVAQAVVHLVIGLGGGVLLFRHWRPRLRQAIP